MKKASLRELIFFVTGRCNSRCRHCFNWRNLKAGADLSLKDIEALAVKLPPIENLLLSGGEPFLRRDLCELIAIFSLRNGIKTVSIPTNGLLPEDIASTTEKILGIPGLKAVNINFSLDGPPKIHDRIRGVEHNYDKALEAIERVSALKPRYPQLHILVNSVISSENQPALLPLASSLASLYPAIDGHYFEIMRPGGPDEFGRLRFSFDFYRSLLRGQYSSFKARMKTGNFFKGVARKIVFLGRTALVYRTQYRNYFFKKSWPFRCSAGRNIMVLNDRGLLSVCESRGRLFDLSEYADFASLADSAAYREELSKVASDRCFCTHVCFLDASLSYRPVWKYPLIIWFGLVYLIYYEIISHHS